MYKYQLKAIKSLEKAFARCAKAGIEFYATDIAIYAMPDGFGDGKDLCEITDEVNDDKVKIVDTSDTYKDCGFD